MGQPGFVARRWGTRFCGWLEEAAAGGVGGDGFIDLEGEGEGVAGLFSSDARGGSGLDGVEEGFKFELEGFAWGGGEFVEGEARGGVGGLGGQSRYLPSGWCGGLGGAWGGALVGGLGRALGGEDGFELGGGEGGGGRDVDQQQVLAGEVEREVLVGLEEAQFADAFGGDAGGGEVGDAAVLKLDADVGDVGLFGEDGEAYGPYFTDWGGDEGEDDVEVVDHEVEDDVDVERAGGEDAEAVALKKHGSVEMRDRCGDGGVEAFEVAYLQDAVVVVGEGDEGVCLCERGGDRFFDQGVDACGEKLCSCCGVMDRRDADAGCLNLQVSGEHFVDGGEGGKAVLGGEASAGGGVLIDQGHEFSLWEIAVDAEVVFAEGACAYDDYFDSLSHYFASTACLQRA